MVKNKKKKLYLDIKTNIYIIFWNSLCSYFLLNINTNKDTAQWSGYVVMSLWSVVQTLLLL